MCKYEIYFYSVCLPFCPYKTGFVTFSKTAEQLALKFTHKIRDSPRIIFWVFNSFLKFVCLATYLSLKNTKSSFDSTLSKTTAPIEVKFCVGRGCFGIYIFLQMCLFVYLSTGCDAPGYMPTGLSLVSIGRKAPGFMSTGRIVSPPVFQLVSPPIAGQFQHAHRPKAS